MSVVPRAWSCRNANKLHTPCTQAAGTAGLLYYGVVAADRATSVLRADGLAWGSQPAGYCSLHACWAEFGVTGAAAAVAVAASPP